MKDFKQIMLDEKIKVVQEIVINGQSVYGGKLKLSKGRRFTFIASIDDGRLEHVSVGLCTSRTETPTWEEMCEVKDLFWNSEEEVHQIHPKASQYLTGIIGPDGKRLENILHLYRPVKGWGNWGGGE